MEEKLGVPKQWVVGRRVSVVCASRSAAPCCFFGIEIFQWHVPGRTACVAFMLPPNPQGLSSWHQFYQRCPSGIGFFCWFFAVKGCLGPRWQNAGVGRESLVKRQQLAID